MSQHFITRSTLMTGLIPTVLLGSGVASAELIRPGDLASDFATTLTTRPDLGGDIEASTISAYTLKNDSGKPIYTGQLANAVVRNAASGALTFYYRLQNGSSDIFGIDDAIAGQFKNFKTDVEILTDSGGETAPTDIFRSFDGKQIYFAFDETVSRISPEEESYTFVVKTNATQFDMKGDTDINGFVAKSMEEDSPIIADGQAKVATFRPIGAAGATSPVAAPLPSPLIAGAFTMIATGLYMRRLRRSVA